MFVRRKKYVCTSICWMFSSPATILPSHPLVARIEAARVADHRHQARSSSAARPPPRRRPRLSASGISTCTCLPAFRHAIALRRVHLRRRAQDHGVHVLHARGSPRDRCVTWPMPNCFGDLLRLVELAADERHDRARRRCSAIASRCLTPNAPAPASATLIVSSLRLPGVLRESDGRRPCSTPARDRSDA